MQKKIALTLSHLVPRIQETIFIGIFVAVFFQGPALLNVDGDLGRHITIGNFMMRNGDIPTRDIFSHTMTGERLVPHEWLAQMALSFMHSLWGLTGVVWMVSVLIAATFTLTYWQMLRKEVSHILAVFITVLATATSSLHWLPRPHIFTFLFTAVWAYQLENEQKKIWLFPLLMGVWANTHGAFIVGFVIWGAHAAGWFWEYHHGKSTKETGIQLLIIGAASLAITFVNPAGWHLWGTSVGYFGSQFLIDQTVEYQSPDFHDRSTWPFLIMLGLGMLASSSDHRRRPHESMLFAGWTMMALYSARNIPLFAIVTAPYIARAIQAAAENSLFVERLEQSITRVEYSLKGIAWPLLGLITLIIAFAAPSKAANQFDPNRFPVKAVDWLEANPQEGKMFNNFIWGGYMLYRLWPQQLVFIDGQTDFYGEALTREYAQVMYLGEGWQAVLEKYDVGWAIVPSSQPLVQVLQQEMGWVTVYQDDTATILHKPRATATAPMTSVYNTASIMIAKKINTR